MQPVKHISTAIALYLIIQLCPLTAASQLSPVGKSILDCDEAAEMLSRSIPPIGEPLDQLAALMRSGQVAIEYPSLYHPRPLPFMSTNPTLQAYFKTIQDTINSLPSTLRATSQQEKELDRIILSSQSRDAKFWNPLTMVYLGLLEFEHQMRQQTLTEDGDIGTDEEQ